MASVELSERVLRGVLMGAVCGSMFALTTYKNRNTGSADGSTAPLSVAERMMETTTSLATNPVMYGSLADILPHFCDSASGMAAGKSLVSSCEELSDILLSVKRAARPSVLARAGTLKRRGLNILDTFENTAPNLAGIDNAVLEEDLKALRTSIEYCYQNIEQECSCRFAAE